ncbi:MAG: anti-sigma factor family protein [Actinomycetota bacterium]
MTSPPPQPPRDDDADRADDEAVSAVLDGEATPAELEQVAGDPALRSRLEEFAGVRAVLATDPDPHADVATEIESLAARRRDRNRQVAGAIGAVAAISLIVIGSLSLFRTSDQGDVLATGSAATENSNADTAAGPARGEVDALAPDGGPAQSSASAPSTNPPTTTVEISGTSGGALSGVNGLQSSQAFSDCTMIAVLPDSRWVTTGSTPCGPLAVPLVTAGVLSERLNDLVASGSSSPTPPVIASLGVGSGPGDARSKCPFLSSLGSATGLVTVSDRVVPVLVVLDAGGAVVLYDSVSCRPL